MNGYKRLLSFAVLLLLHSNLSFSQGNLYPNGKSPYPIIFVHGLVSSDEAFKEPMLYLNGGAGTGDYVGQWGPINVFDVVLNADDNINTAQLAQDVKWEDFTFNGNNINVGQRNFADDPDDFIDGWTTSSIFAINFDEKRIRGALGTIDDLFEGSNQSAIFKQGYALSKLIDEVLSYTNAQKVILVGHSMGGLAIREYLQRTNDGTPGSPHTWWVDQTDQQYGHKVARVITIGTPHLGSNSYTDPTFADPTFSLRNVRPNSPQDAIPDEDGEALRDLKYSYDSYPNCSLLSPVGIYLFGGTENCIKGTLINPTFANVDINCNGNENDFVVGINKYNETTFNPNMPLPPNIEYTWITSNSNMGENSASLLTCGIIGTPTPGDGAVLLSKQWLYDNNNKPAPLGFADTLLTNKPHSGPICIDTETKDVLSIIRGLDEPDSAKTAYAINLNVIYGAFFSRQPSDQNNPNDTDCYKIIIPSPGDVLVDFDALFSDVTFVLKDASLNTIGEFQNQTVNVIFNVPAAGGYYLYIIKNVSNMLGDHLYYDFRVRNIAAPLAEFSAFPTSGSVPLNVQFTDLSTSGNPITSRLWNFGDGVTSTATSPTHTFTSVGNYTVSLTVSDGVSSDTETKTNYITVNPTGPLPVIEVSGTITANTVWVAGYVYKIVGSVTVANGVTLTIQPAVIVKFSDEQRLDISGALVADGTPTQKIVFTSLRDDSYGGDTNNDGSATTPAAGNWDGMIFRNPSDDAVCKLNNCVIRYGGASFNGSLKANVKCEGASPTISNNEISYSATFGIYLDGSSPQISGNVIANNSGGYGIYAFNGSSPIIDNNTLVANIEGIHSETSTPTITNNTFTNAQGGFAISLSNMPAGLNPITGNTGSGNYVNGIGLSGGLGTSSTLRAGNVNLPYVFSGLTINAGTTLTIEPGVVVKFFDENRLTIDGALVAEGTPTQKIVFTSLKDDSYGGDTNNDGSATTPAAGNWDGMIFRNPSDDAVCKLNNCVIRYGGASFNGSLKANVKCEGASPTISNNEISYSATFGIYLDGSSPQISGNVIANNSGGYGIYAFNGSSPIIDNNTLVANIEGIHSETSTPTITNNTFTNAQGGFAISLSNMPAGLNPITGNTGSGNYVNGIGLSGGLGTSSTLRAGNVNLPYVFSGLTINAGTTLTIEPGVVVKFFDENRLTIDGALVAEGTPTQKIVFTSLKDDSYGGDTNNDGSATTPAAGNWDGMIFRNPSDDAVCKLNNCVIRYGGASFNGSLKANVKCEGASPTISNNEISYSATFGIYLDGSSPQISGNVIANNSGGYGIYAFNGSSPIIDNNTLVANIEGIHSETSTPTITNNTFTNAQGGFAISLSNMPAGLNPITGNTGSGNYVNGIGLSGGLGTSSTLRAGNVNLPYVFSGLTINAGTTLTIEPGVVVKFFDENRLTIDGALVAEGTPTQKIVFTSLKDDSYGGDTNNDGSATTPAAGNWDGMIFRNPSDDAVCKLNNCVIRYGGASFNGSLKANVKCEGASPTISNNEISYSATFGIYLDGSSPQISGNVIANNSGGYGIYAFNGSSPIIDNNTLVANIEGIHSETSTPTITNNTFTNAQGGFAISLSNMPAGLNPITGNTGSGNFFNGIALTGGLGTSSTLRAGNVNLPYVFSGLTINAGTTLTIEPGVVVKFSNETRLNIDGALVADGTPTQKIVFTSLKDDSYGGDTNNDGSATTPVAGNWDGMIFRDASDDAVCKLDNCVIRYGGASFNGSLQGNVNCERASPTISNNELSYSATQGIYLDGSSPQISGNLIANNSNAGIYAFNGSSPIVNGNSFSNSGFGLLNTTTSSNINAHQNWWGDATGPLDNSDDRATGGLYNPNGLGNQVSDYVDYDPWLTAPGTGTTVPDIAVNPISHNYGNVGIGSSASQTFVVSNQGTTDLQVTATTLAGADVNQFSIVSGGAPFTLAAAQSQNLVVNFNPASAGSKSANLQIANNDPNENPFSIALTGTGSAVPQISINDVTVTEGNSGTVNAVFTVSLSFASSQQVTVDYATADGTATAGSDYVALQTTQLIFPPNTTTQTITVMVNGDVLDEIDETFFVNLSNATNATIADNQGQGTITNDDPLPSLSINDVTVTEGNAGTVNAVFTVTLSAASGKQVTVDYSTADGTATAGTDYDAIPSTQLVFPLGTTTQTITAVVKGDVLTESNEMFFVNLSNPTNATILDAQGMCMITDDDVPLVTIVLNPAHDAYVRSDQTSSNFGTATTLRMKQSSPIYNSYLKFVASNISGPVQSAKLRMKVTVASSSGGSVYSVSNNRKGTSQPWTQSNLNYNNAPAISGTPLDTEGNVTVGQIVEFDVTSAVTGNNTFSFGLNNASTTTVQYSSKEGATKPELVIQFVPQPPAITSFNPSSGAVGTQVIITGNNFTGATQVAFNAVAASVFTVNSSTQITATVPTGATTGKITVTTPGGTATSSTDFIVPIVFNPTHDAYVKSDQATTNFGTATTLRMRQASIILNSYLKFMVSGLSGTVQSAKLRMKVTTASSSGGSVYSVSCDYLGTSTPWTETGINYNNAPSIGGTPLDTEGSVTVNQIVEFDVTSAINGNGTFCFGLKNSSTTAVQYSSKEGATKPELVIQTSAGALAKAANREPDAVALEKAETIIPLPKEFALSANYPNPFNAQTVIEYALPEAVNVRLVIFNILGQRVRRLVDENQSAGYKRVIWNGRNEFGLEVGSGIYFLQMEVARQKFVRKMFLQR